MTRERYEGYGDFKMFGCYPGTPKSKFRLENQLVLCNLIRNNL